MHLSACSHTVLHVGCAFAGTKPGDPGDTGHGKVKGKIEGLKASKNLQAKC